MSLISQWLEMSLNKMNVRESVPSGLRWQARFSGNWWLRLWLDNHLLLRLFGGRGEKAPDPTAFWSSLNNRRRGWGSNSNWARSECFELHNYVRIPVNLQR